VLVCPESSRLLVGERRLWWLSGGQVAAVRFMREALLIERLRLETSAPPNKSLVCPESCRLLAYDPAAKDSAS
jgi:hypothetical protein